MSTEFASENHDRRRQRFELKLRNFLADHSFTSGPTLVFQCAPVSNAEIDVESLQVRQALAAGTGLASSQSWDGFKSSVKCKKVFDGLMAGPFTQKPGWATEVHEDGHVIAALRADEPGDTPRIYIFLADAFNDFGWLVNSIYAAAEFTDNVDLTATLVNGKGVQLINNKTFGQARGRLVTRETFDWPILPAAGENEVLTMCQRMASRFERLFDSEAPLPR